MRVLIYTRTHSGDPTPETGVFGQFDCMGRVRDYRYDAVIGLGGHGHEPIKNNIAEKLTWIGIGPRKQNGGDRRGQLVTFDHFKYYGERGPRYTTAYPMLGERMNRVRLLMLSESSMEWPEVKKILARARHSPESGMGGEKENMTSSASTRPGSRNTADCRTPN